MEDIPQPSPEPYEPGDTVRVSLPCDDVDARFHGVVCSFVNVHCDDLDQDTERDLDRHSYRLKTIKSGDV